MLGKLVLNQQSSEGSLHLQSRGPIPSDSRDPEEHPTHYEAASCSMMARAESRD